MSFPRYPKYKDSGVEWMGEIPEHWNVSPLKEVADVINGYPFDSELFSQEGGFPLVRIRDLHQDSTETLYAGSFVQRAAITSEDVLIGMDGEFNVGRWRGPGKALLNQRMCCIRGNTPTATRLLEYALPVPMRLINEATYSTTVKHLSSRQVERTRFAVPSDFCEQLAIVEFLDHEASKIDELIAEQERLITLLTAKRDRAISKAVTKGLDDNAPLKQSGVDWIGEIPIQWNVVPLRWSTTYRSGTSLGSVHMEASDTAAIPVIGGNGVLGFTNLSNTPHEALAVGRVGALCGNVHIVTPPAWVTDNALRVVPDPNIFDLAFLAEALRARGLNELASKTAQPLITGSQLGDQRMPVPPLDAQRQIAAFIEAEESRLTSLVKSTRSAQELLRERRAALISAAVTGKIDVRNLATSEAA